MTIAKVARVVVSGTIGGSVTWNNTFHFATDTPGVGPGLLISDLLLSAWNMWNAGGSWVGAVTSFCVFNNMSGQSLYPNTTEYATRGLGGVAGVAAGGPTSPAPCAGVVTWKTGLPGRSYRGRSYIAGVPLYQAAQTLGEVVAPGAWVRGKLDQIGATTMARFGAGRAAGTGDPGGWYLLCYSRKRGTAVGATVPDGCQPTTSYSIPNYWATMGTRRGGHGM